MEYKSTRGNIKVTSTKALIEGLSADGGLFVPIEFPKVELNLKEFMNKNYNELAFFVLKNYFNDFDENTLLNCITKAYDDKFDTKEIAPLVKKDNFYFLELFHGKTLAFKDMALSLFPHLLKEAKLKENIKKEIVILTATSGDTGKAALEVFKDIEGVKIIVFYPSKGVSNIQKLQMITQEGENTYVFGINGNFDDAQRAVKEIFSDVQFNEKIAKRGYVLSSANSINIGRLFPQIIYYFYAYINLLKMGEISEDEYINIVVPTGNFGNILAAYYAKKMGLKVKKLICASNKNNVLYDFLREGVYDVRRNFYTTISPSMDILVSSNLERFLYDACGEDEKIIRNLMKDLKELGYFSIPENYRDSLKDFYTNFADDDETYFEIRWAFLNLGYLIDPHTAVALNVYKKYLKDTGDDTKTIIASTASPYKFVSSVYKAITLKEPYADEFELSEELSKLTNTSIPKQIVELKNKRILHNDVIDKEEIYNVINDLLKGD